MFYTLGIINEILSLILYLNLKIKLKFTKILNITTLGGWG